MHHVKAVVLKTNGKQRSGKGFSSEEIKKAGLNPVDARKMGLPVDLRRNTVHEENIKVAKAYAEKSKAKAKPKPKPAVAARKEKSKS
jgi:ribosomal protein L13E